jgi:hypothetical protein
MINMALASSDLILRKMEESQERFDPTHIRPSAISSCARKQVYAALGYPANEEAMRELEGIAFLGNLLDRSLADFWSRMYPGKTYRQFELRTPYGIVAHPDIWVPGLNLDVEVKSVSVGAKYYGLPKPEHVDQLQLRLHFHHKYRKKEGVRGEIIYFFRETFLDPESWAPLSFPIEYDPEKGQELETRLNYIMECVERKELPEREGTNPDYFPCKSKTKYLQAECPYRDACWEGHTEEPATLVQEAEEILQRYAELDGMRKNLQKNADAVKAELQELQEQLNAIFDREQTERITAGGYSMKRSYTPPRKVEYEAKGYYRYYLKKEEK